MWVFFMNAMDLLPLDLVNGAVKTVAGDEVAHHTYFRAVPTADANTTFGMSITVFFLILFYPVMRSGAMPVPFMRPFYQALGARLGPNTYSSGLLLDPPFVQLGANCIVGQYALVVPHVMRFLFGPLHRTLLIASALAGAILMLLADIASRMLIAPQSLPVGVVTALVGVPFFAVIIYRSRNK